MKYIGQATIIFAFTLAGELLHVLLPLPIPAAIYGLVLLFLALVLGIVKVSQVDGASKFLIATMGVLFVAPGVSILEVWEAVAPSILWIVLIALLSTAIVFAVSALVTQAMLKKGEKDRG